MSNPESQYFVVCVENDDVSASLEKRKIYVALQDLAAEEQGLIRVIDESGEDYLYPADFFRAIELTLAMQKAVLAA